MIRWPWICPCRGTSTVSHLEDNLAAAGLEVSDDVVTELTEAVG